MKFNRSFLSEFLTWFRMMPSPMKEWNLIFDKLRPIENFRRLGHNSFVRETLSGFIRDHRVLILGGFKGDSTARYLELHPHEVQVFEPVPEFFEELRTRFAANKAVKLHNFAAGAKDGIILIGVGGDETGIRANGEVRALGVVSLENWLGSLDKNFGFTEINIEGGEYELFEALSQNSIAKLGAIALQFHFDDQESRVRRKAIEDKLSETHVKIMNLDLVWCLWVPKEVKLYQ